MQEISEGHWRASCNFGDESGTRAVMRVTPAHIPDDPGGEAAKAALLKEIAHRRKLLGVTADGTRKRHRLPMSPHGSYVYILWGHDRRRPLYIGQSTNVLFRLGQHIYKRGSEIKDLEIIECQDVVDMCKLEQQLIGSLCPLWNQVFNPHNARSTMPRS